VSFTHLGRTAPLGIPHKLWCVSDDATSPAKEKSSTFGAVCGNDVVVFTKDRDGGWKSGAPLPEKRKVQ
jgi:hypothetical protein